MQKKIKVSGNTISVVLCKKQSDVDITEKFDGIYSDSDQQIRIKSGYSQSYQNIILFHEITHAIEYAYDCKLDENSEDREHKVEVIGRAFLNIIRDNPKLIYDILDTK